MDRGRSWEKNGSVLCVVLVNLNATLQKNGFGEAQLGLPGGKMISRAAKVGIWSAKEYTNWDRRSCSIEVSGELTDQNSSLALGVRVSLHHEGGSLDAPCELAQTFLCYQRVEEDLLSTVQDGIDLMHKRSLKSAFLDSRWEAELEHWITMGYLPRAKTLACKRILRKFSQTGTLDHSSMTFVNGCLMAQKVIPNRQKRLFHDWSGPRGE